MISGKALAKMGTQLAKHGYFPGRSIIKYSEYDCQGFMELIFKQCGQPIAYAGSNDMFRNACTWVGTLEEAKKQGYLQEGAALFILEQNGGEPTKYKADGIGNASHVGMYVGENALQDFDKNGNFRECNVVHSSSSMGRVAGSTLKNGWTHVGLWKNVSFDVMSAESEDDTMVDMGGLVEAEYAKVQTANGKPLNFRTKMDKRSALVPRLPEIPNGATVEVNYSEGNWSHISYGGYDGFVMSEFLSPIDNDTSMGNDDAEDAYSPNVEDETIGDVNEKARLYRVYIDFTNKKDALAFQAAMSGCQVGSVK